MCKLRRINLKLNKARWILSVCLFVKFMLNLAIACSNVSSGICGQRRPRSDCADAQADLSLRCRQTESLDTIECFSGEQMPGRDLL